jgi:hypothetical protein
VTGFKEENYAAYVAAAQALWRGPHGSADRLGELAALSEPDLEQLSERLRAQGLFRNPSLQRLAERASTTIDTYLRGENAHGHRDCYRAVCVGGNTYVPTSGAAPKVACT